MENKQRNNILMVLFFGVLMGALDIAIVGPALPSIKKAFEVDERILAWMFSIYVLFNLISTPLMAKLSDQFGRRSVYIADIALFAAGSLLVAMAPAFGFVLAGRAIQGFGAGGIFPVASAVIGDTFPPEKRGSALGLIGAVFGIAFIVGPVVGGIILWLASWQWLFIINIPIAIVLIALSLRLLPDTHPAKSGAFDWAGMLTLSVALAAFAVALNRIDTGNALTSLFSFDVLPYLVVAIGLVPVLIQIEKRVSNPILRLDLFQKRQMVLSYVLSIGAGIGESGLVFMPLLAVAAFGIKSSEASFLLMPLVFAMAIISPVSGRMLDRYGSKLVIISGTALMGLGMFALGFLGALGIGFYIFASVLIGAGLAALLGAPIRYIMLNEASSADRSVAQGIVAISTSIGQLIGSATVGAIAASIGGVPGYTNAYITVGVIAIFLVIAATALKSRSDELAAVKASHS